MPPGRLLRPAPDTCSTPPRTDARLRGQQLSWPEEAPRLRQASVLVHLRVTQAPALGRLLLRAVGDVVVAGELHAIDEGRDARRLLAARVVVLEAPADATLDRLLRLLDLRELERWQRPAHGGAAHERDEYETHEGTHHPRGRRAAPPSDPSGHRRRR